MYNKLVSLSNKIFGLEDGNEIQISGRFEMMAENDQINDIFLLVK